MITLEHLLARPRSASPKPNGYIALVTVLVVGAVSASIATSLLLVGVGTSRSSADSTRGAEARGYANACIETALQLIWTTPAFSGSGGLSLGNGSCTYNVAGSTVTVTGISGEASQRATAVIAGTTSYITLSSWQENP